MNQLWYKKNKLLLQELKSFVAILLSVVFLLSSMQQTTYILLFNLNKKAIIENYCINKAKKAMQCNARCYIKKALLQEKNEDKNNPFSILNLNLSQVDYFYKPGAILFKIREFQKITITLLNPNNIDKLLDGVKFLPIKPPIFIT